MSNLSIQSSAPFDLIHVIDSNKDGKLQPDTEIKMSAFQRAAIDADQNGEVSTREMSVALEQDRVIINYTGKGAADIKLNDAVALSPQANAGLVKFLDADGNQTITSKEVNIIAEQVKFMDSDADGALSHTEVLNALNSGKALVKAGIDGNPALRLNPQDYRTSTTDPAQGHIYLGGLAGGALGAGIGALVGPRFGVSPHDAAGGGALIGAIAGTVSGAVYTSVWGENQTHVSELSDRDKLKADPKLTRKYSMVGMGIGAVAGAAAGWLVFGRTGLMGPKTAMFAGASALATVGGGIGNGIGTMVSKNRQETTADQ